MERWLPEDEVPAAGKFRRVRIKITNDTDREIVYEDFGG
jgi:hypothetical protein